MSDCINDDNIEATEVYEALKDFIQGQHDTCYRDEIDHALERLRFLAKAAGVQA